MTNKGVAIRYGDVAPGAKENFKPWASESQFDNLSQLQQYNLQFPNYANPCELYSVVLDGTASAFPSTPEGFNLGLWSRRISNEVGVFNEPIELELKSEGMYSSQGFTLTFDTYNDIYATRVKIKWMRVSDGDEITLDEREFVPTSAFYFCHNQVENYNKVVMTFYSINMPKNRLKLRVVDYGYGTFFYSGELRNVDIAQAIDPISSQISINTADFTLDSKRDIEYSFQTKQPLSIYFNGQLKATTFVKTAKRLSRFLWEIHSEDYIGLLENIPYYGGIYDNVKAVDILADIFRVANVPYEIDDVFADLRVSGHISYTTCREALMQVAFAIQGVVDTSGFEVIKVYSLTNDSKQTIPLNRIKLGQSFTDDESVTGVEIDVHAYKPILDKTTVYNASESGSGEGIFVKFSEPLHNLKIGYIDEDDNRNEFVEDSSVGEILESGTNYAIINANDNCVLQGCQYDHTTQKRKKNIEPMGANAIEKVVPISNATLISVDNIDNVMDKCFAWLTKVNSVNLDIIEGKHIAIGGKIKYGQKKYGTFKYGERVASTVSYDKAVNVGEIIHAETEYLGTVSGRIISQTYNLNGNIIVKKAVLK